MIRPMALAVLALIGMVACAAATPVESLVAIVGPEGFWRFVFHTTDGDHVWTVFVSRDTIVTEQEIAVSWADSTTAVVSFTVPALECTAYTFVDPPWPPATEKELTNGDDD